MSVTFLDRVAASTPKPRPRFKLFRTRLVMNRDARQVYFSGAENVLLGFDPENGRLAIKILPHDVYEHDGWRAFRIQPREGAAGDCQIAWRQFWDREIGLAGGRPIVLGEQAVRRLGEDIIAINLS